MTAFAAKKPRFAAARLPTAVKCTLLRGTTLSAPRSQVKKARLIS
jgi:hypothetical protein